MYQINDYIVYGTNGVCKIEDIGTPNITGIDKEKKYYVLKPLYSNGSTIFTPIDNTKIIMRRIITNELVEELIDSIPSITTLESGNNIVLEDKYKAALNTFDCKEFVRIIKTVYRRKIELTDQGKKLGQIDERYMKQAEDLLYGELAIPLNIPKENVEKYICDKIEHLEKV